MVGPRDAEGRKVSVRAFGTEANLGEIGFDAFVDGLVREYRTRGAETVKGGMGAPAKRAAGERLYFRKHAPFAVFITSLRLSRTSSDSAITCCLLPCQLRAQQFFRASRAVHPQRTG